MLFEGMRNWTKVSLLTLALLELAVAREPTASNPKAPTAITRRRRRDTGDTFSGCAADCKGWKLRDRDAVEVSSLHLAQDQTERLDRCRASLIASRLGRPSAVSYTHLRAHET